MISQVGILDISQIHGIMKETRMSLTTQKIIDWINSKAVQETINSKANWKLVINGAGSSFTTVIERHDKHNTN